MSSVNFSELGIDAVRIIKIVKGSNDEELVTSEPPSKSKWETTIITNKRNIEEYKENIL